MVNFAGVPNNFDLQPQQPHNPSPMSGAGVANSPTPVGPSMSVPGVPASSGADFTVPPAQVANATITDGQQASPLDKYKDLFNNTPTVDESGKPAAPELTILDAGYQDYLKGSQNLDFTRGIQKESLTKIAEGGEAAVEALGEILNAFGKNVYSQAMAGSTKVAKEGFKLEAPKAETKMQELLKFNELRSQVSGDANSQVINHPAVAPLMAGINQQLIAKFPNASVAELRQMSVDYVTSLGTVFQKAPAAPTPESQPFDFGAFFQE